MNSTRRFAGRIGSAFALCALLLCGPVRAANLSFVFQNQTLLFTHIARTDTGSALGVDDPAFRSLLKALGATLTWNPGERYVLISTAQPLVVSFSVGSKRYDVGLLSADATFAPYVQGQEVFLPLDDLLRALGLTARADASGNVLQPQLTSVDVQGSGNQAVVIAHAAIALHPRVAVNDPDRIVYAFDGVASSLDGVRQLNVGGIRTMRIVSSGSIRQPSTSVELDLAPNARHDAPRSNNGDFEVAFGGNNSAPPLVSAAAPPPNASSNELPVASSSAPVSTAAAGATVPSVTLQPNGGGTMVTIAVNGNASYEWHRLRAPDNRFWIDIHGAQLLGGPIEQAEAGPVTSLRVRQNDAETVRVALSLDGSKSLEVSPSANGVLVTVGNDDVAEFTREGNGSVGSVVSANEAQPLITPVPADQYGQNDASSNDDSGWKFGPRSTYVPTNPRLIVIDPGHGGSDRGAVRNGLSEAAVNLDMAQRLRSLLVARGWQVKMTHATDVDVYQPNDSAHDELQARCDIANQAGARVFVSIHSNSFINSGPSGTTVYYSKPGDYALAQILDRDVVPLLGTKNDGTIKAHYYVTMHTDMPAVLIETAFLSNPSDFVKLDSPDWREKVAEGIANGIDEYARAYPVSGQAQ